MRPLLALFLTTFITLGSKPNIVFILADDLGIKDLSCEGSEFYETPHIDRIAEKSTRFTRGYSACQVCSPSRASILTGLYPPKHGITDYIGATYGENWPRNTKLLPAEYANHLPHESKTLAETLQDAGYATGFFGKWHLGDKGSFPEDHGFQVNVGGYSKGGPYGTKGKGSGFFAPFGNPKIETEPKNGEPLPYYLGKETANFITKNKEHPFLAYLSFYAVHAPIQSSEKLWQKYRAKADKLGHIGDGKERFLFDRTKNVRQVQDFPTYAGLLELMDDGVGIVLDTLKELGLEENTIVIFTSDNGGVSSGDAYATSCLPFRGGKGRQWEGGIRQPFYIHLPGTEQPKENASLVNGIDFYPTLLDLCDVEFPKGQELDGISLVPALKEGAKLERPLYWHYPHYGNQGGEPSSIIMDGDWKLIHYLEDDRQELYNLSEDIGETNDLAAKVPEKVAELSKQLKAWLKESGAKLPTLNPKYNEKADIGHRKELATKRKQKLENQHANFLAPNFQPNGNWWGSTTD